MVAKSFIPDEHSGPPEALLVLVPVGVVQTEGLVNGGALVHELDGAAGVGGDVADGEQPMGEGRSTCMRRGRRTLVILTYISSILITRDWPIP